jgi:hypothetical protein
MKKFLVRFLAGVLGYSSLSNSDFDDREALHKVLQ